MAGEEKLITLDALSLALPSWMKRSTKPSYTADDISTTGTTNQFVTANEKNTWNGKYALPSGGIPKTDLASAVQTSLEKADSAIQTETDPTVPSWAKQQNPPTYTSDDINDTNQTHKFATAEQLQQISTNQTNISSVEDMITDKEFDSTKSYSIGDVVTYEHKLYKFKSAHSGAWSTSDVDQITVIAYVDDHSGGGGGAVSGVKGDAESTYRTGDVNITCDNIGASPNDHSHGSIGRNGDISNDVTIGSSDKLLISDYSDSNRIKTSSIYFDGSTTTQFLSKKGTWETPSSSGGVTGVKGSNESTYRTGNVSLSYSNVGAAPYTHYHDSNYIQTPSYYEQKTSGSLDNITESCVVYCSSNVTGGPVSSVTMMVETYYYSSSYRTQRAEVMSGSYAGHVFSRYYNSSWSSWIDLTLNVPITLATSGNISSASIDLSSILTGTYLFTVTNNESGTSRYGCSLYVLQKFDSGTVYVMKPVSEVTNAKLSSYSFSGNTMSLSFDKSGYKTLRLICLYR